MAKNKKKIALVILTLFCAIFLLNANSVFAQRFELTYPKIGTLELKPGSSIQEYIKYFYTLLISFTGIIALISITWGGLYWLTSSGDPGKISEGRKRITAGLTGVILILSSHLILTLINPDLTTIRLTREPPKQLKTAADLRGIIICKENINQTDIDTREGLFDRIKEGNCFEANGQFSLPNEYRGENFKIRKTPGDNNNYYVIMTNRSPSQGSLVNFDQCSVLVAPADQSFESLLSNNLNREETEFIMIGTYSQGSSAINFCYTDDPSCNTEPTWEIIANGGELINFENENKLEPKDVQAQRNPSNVMSPVRWARTTSDINYIVISNEKELDGKCYITNSNDSDVWNSFGTQDNFDLKDSNNVQQNKYFQTVYANIGSMVVFPKIGFNEIIGTPVNASECAQFCGDDQAVADCFGVPYNPSGTTDLRVDGILRCVKDKARTEGKNLGSTFTYDESHPLCNYTRGNNICPGQTCSHTTNSCHYGGRSGITGALAIDFGNEQLERSWLENTIDECINATTSFPEDARPWFNFEEDHWHVSMFCDSR